MKQEQSRVDYTQAVPVPKAVEQLLGRTEGQETWKDVAQRVLSEAPVVAPDTDTPIEQGRSSAWDTQNRMILLLGPILGAMMAKHGITHFRKEQDNKLMPHSDRINDLIWLAKTFVEKVEG